MKKFVTLFTDSARELKSVRTITTMAMLAAVAVILGYFSIEYGQFIRIGFSGIPNGIVDYLFGPVAGAVFHGALDIIKYLMKPTGPFCPQLTLVVMLAGVLYGCFFYKKKLTIWRVLAAKFVVMLICNVILSLWQGSGGCGPAAWRSWNASRPSFRTLTTAKPLRWGCWKIYSAPNWMPLMRQGASGR